MPLKPFNKILLLATVLLTSLFFYDYSCGKTTFYGDASGYYRYLPSAFIYHNLVSYDALPTNKGISADILQYTQPVKDDKDTTKIIINQYTYGIALLEAPFFLIAHAFELARGSNANGYSYTYDLLIKLSTLLYALLGLIIVYKILRRYFDETLSVLGIIGIYAGTNLFWFSTLQAGMSHVPLFLLYALLMYWVMIVHDRPSTKLFIAIGLTAGMITIIRPTDIICIAIPLFYNVYNIDTIKNKLLFIRQNLLNILYLCIAFAIPILPQLIYWKVVTGNFVYYSYRDQSFDWAHPKITEGLFHFSNGWLPYSPIMIFSLLGLLLYRKMKPWAWCSWILLPTYIYIVYSWYCYRYINGLGSRPMIHLYPLLAIPLTAFIQFMSQRALWLKTLFGIIALFFVAININYSYQQKKGILWSEESNIAFNTQMLFRTELRYEDLVVNDVTERQPDTSNITKICTLYTEHYDDSTIAETVSDPITGHKYVYHLLEDEFPKISVVVKYHKEQFKDAKWIKCSGRFMYNTAPDYFKHLLVITVPDKLWRGCKIENKTFDWHTLPGHKYITLFDYKENSWGSVYYFANIPDNLTEGDDLKLFVWNLNKTSMYFDDLCLELYK